MGNLLNVGDTVSFSVNDHYGRIITVIRKNVTDGKTVVHDLLPSSHDVTVGDIFVAAAVMNLLLESQEVQLVAHSILDQEGLPKKGPLEEYGRAILRDPSPLRVVCFVVQSISS